MLRDKSTHDGPIKIWNSLNECILTFVAIILSSTAEFLFFSFDKKVYKYFYDKQLGYQLKFHDGKG